MPLDPHRTVQELRELQALTSDARGAQRVAWTPVWQAAREWLATRLADLPVDVEIDAAGNQWATLRGSSPRALILGSHIDSVPDGGWLDGSLGVLAGLEVLRAFAEPGDRDVTIRLVSWADEEGRFGHSLLGSSAACGDLDARAASELRDRNGVGLVDALQAYGVDLAQAHTSRGQLENAAAYLELHIEQGPILEDLGLALGVVEGTKGVERHLVRFVGQTAHSGSTPMNQRRDTVLAAARLALEVRDIARRAGGHAVGTVGRMSMQPGIPTAVAGSCELTVEFRHLDPAGLGRLLAESRAAADRIGRAEQTAVEWQPLYAVSPAPFDPTMIDICDEAVRSVAGSAHHLPSGPLHDATAVARAGVPTGMIFVQSLRGLSHTIVEDSAEAHLRLGVSALHAAARSTVDHIAATPSTAPAGVRGEPTPALTYEVDRE